MVILDDELGLDYFDASTNRVAAWVIRTRNMPSSKRRRACPGPPSGTATACRRARRSDEPGSTRSGNAGRRFSRSGPTRRRDQTMRGGDAASGRRS
ncbi:MAG: L-rhamnose isomerase [Bryobacteraceae bacterium]